MPILVAMASNGTASLERIQSFEPAAPDLAFNTPRRVGQEDETIAYLPMIGGASLEPTAGLWGGELVVSNSRPRAEELLSRPCRSPEPVGRGNVFARVHPYPCAEAIRDAGLLFADIGALKGHTTESFRGMMAPWLEWASQIHELNVRAGHEQGTINFDITLEMAVPAQEQGSAQPEDAASNE